MGLSKSSGHPVLHDWVDLIPVHVLTGDIHNLQKSKPKVSRVHPELVVLKQKGEVDLFDTDALCITQVMYIPWQRGRLPQRQSFPPRSVLSLRLPSTFPLPSQ